MLVSIDLVVIDIDVQCTMYIHIHTNKCIKKMHFLPLHVLPGMSQFDIIQKTALHKTSY